jgi:hypothetical protein
MDYGFDQNKVQHIPRARPGARGPGGDIDEPTVTGLSRAPTPSAVVTLRLCDTGDSAAVTEVSDDQLRHVL